MQNDMVPDFKKKTSKKVSSFLDTSKKEKTYFLRVIDPRFFINRKFKKPFTSGFNLMVFFVIYKKIFINDMKKGNTFKICFFDTHDVRSISDSSCHKSSRENNVYLEFL